MRRDFFFLFCFILLCSACARKTEGRYTREYRPNTRLPVVVLDPGHGGSNDGTKMVIAPYTKEKVLALQTALKARDLLEQWGYVVRMTRTKDVYVPLEGRVKMAKDFRGLLFVSIHFNHAPNKQAQGIEVFYYGNTKYTAASKRLSQDILSSIVERTKAPSRGCHEADFHVLRENSMPAVLVEGGFFSNAVEAKKLCNPKYVSTLAYSIAKGIDDFVQDELVQHAKSH